jgi:hypothetical protein
MLEWANDKLRLPSKGTLSFLGAMIIFVGGFYLFLDWNSGSCEAADETASAVRSGG